jgi:ATP-dependent helicase/DNAse subunit B
MTTFPRTVIAPTVAVDGEEQKEAQSDEACLDESQRAVLKLSATRIKTYLQCPRQYRYKYVEKIAVPLSGALAFGQIIHQVLHNLHQWSIYSGEPLNEEVALTDFARLWDKAIKEESAHFKSEDEIAEYSWLAEVILIGYVEANRDKAQPLVMEFPFEIEVCDEDLGRDYILCGTIDRIDQTDKGLVIIDYKSGKRKPSSRDLAFDLQLTVYAHAAKEVFGQEIMEVQLYHLRDQTVFHATRGAADSRTLLQSTMPDVLEGIDAERFSPRIGYWCRFCDHRERCQAEGADERA